MCMVNLIKTPEFRLNAADNLTNYVEIDFENHLIPVVSSLLSPMRDFERFKEEDLKITISVLVKIIKKLIVHLEYMEELGALEYYLSQAHGHKRHMTDSVEYDMAEEKSAEPEDSIHDIIDHVADGVNGNHLNPQNLPIPMANLNSIHDQSVEYDDVNQEFYRVRNALSLIEMWPHIRLLVEGYILLWYLHPDQYIREKLNELLSVVRHKVIIDNIDPVMGPPSIYEQIQRYNSRHHKNDGYSNSGGVNLGTNGTNGSSSHSNLSPPA